MRPDSAHKPWKTVHMIRAEKIKGIIHMFWVKRSRFRCPKLLSHAMCPFEWRILGKYRNHPFFFPSWRWDKHGSKSECFIVCIANIINLEINQIFNLIDKFSFSKSKFHSKTKVFVNEKFKWYFSTPSKIWSKRSYPLRHFSLPTSRLLH